MMNYSLVLICARRRMGSECMKSRQRRMTEESSLRHCPVASARHGTSLTLSRSSRRPLEPEPRSYRRQNRESPRSSYHTTVERKWLLFESTFTACKRPHERNEGKVLLANDFSRVADSEHELAQSCCCRGGGLGDQKSFRFL